MSMLKGSGERASELLPVYHPRDVANTCGEIYRFPEQEEPGPPW